MTSTGGGATANGETTDWTVVIVVPGGAVLGNYLVDIEYNEVARPPSGLVEGGAMQDATTAQCVALPSGTTLNLKDARDNKVYRVRKMVDGRCWMIDNLAYDIGNAPGRPAYLARVELNPYTSLNSRAQYMINPSYTTAAGQTTYLYNWCAAMADTSANCAVTVAYAWGPTDPQTGICPAPFRLPIGGGEAYGSYGDASTTTNEFAKLDIAMGGSGKNGYRNYYLFTGTGTSNVNWFGVLSGFYNSGFYDDPNRGGFYFQGTWGSWWSSTVQQLDYPAALIVYALALFGGVDPVVNVAGGGTKESGLAVRCIL
jgi:uncharacterized protein (TIGR02145 family)